MLKTCTHILDSNCQPEPLREEKKDLILSNVIKNQFAKKSFRTILVAYKELSMHDFEHSFMPELSHCHSVEEKIRIFERDLTVIAIFGL